MRSRRNGRVRSPRKASQASCGERIAPRVMYGPSNTSRTMDFAAHSTPTITSLWPARYLVPECTTTSMPSASGDCPSGVA